MFDEFLKKAADLRLNGESFATATVVRFDGSISGKPGDKAIIYPDGRVWGWVGGGCTQPAVIKEALKALDDGEPRFVRISPPPKPKSEPRIVDYTMTCHSGGTLDVYIEPVLPKPKLLIFGRSPIAQSLAAFAHHLNFGVTVLAEGVGRDDFPNAEAIYGSFEPAEKLLAANVYVVVSTQGEADEEALAAAVRLNPRYIAFVASRKKAQKVFDYLQAEGVSPDQLSRVHSPAGLNIGAVAPEEIALSILAEIVQVRRSKLRPEIVPASPHVTDPVCGMTVDPVRTKHSTEHGGRMFYFCCAGCKQRFESDPAKYLQSAAV